MLRASLTLLNPFPASNSSSRELGATSTTIRRRETEPKDPIGKQIASSIKPLSQAKFNFKLSPRGEVTDVRVPEESQKLLQGVQLGTQVGGAFSQDSFRGDD